MNLSVPIRRRVRGTRTRAVLMGVGTLVLIVEICTPAVGSQSVAYQIDAAHTGSQSDNVIPPLAQRWSRDLGNPISYPIVADGRIFVTVENHVFGTTLYALDERTGATLWGPIELKASYGSPSGITYEAGRLFALNYDGLLRAFDGASGSLLWTTSVGLFPLSAPTAFGGMVFVGAGRVIAVAEQDGAIKWTSEPTFADHSSPAISPTGIYVAYACGHAYDFDPLMGTLIWHHSTSCYGAAGYTAVLFDGRLYTRDPFGHGNFVLDAATGAELGSFSAGPAPAFAGSTGYFLNGSTLEAHSVSSGALQWSFVGDGTLSSAPIVDNGYVYIGSTSGKLYALAASTGANVWIGNVGAAVTYPDEDNARVLTGLGAGDGLIVVPASNLLVAYEPTQSQPSRTIQFSSSSYTAAETDQRVNLTLTRSGDITSSASVGFATSDAAGLQNCNVINGIASPRCDYATTLGTVSFGAGEISRTFSVAIVDDAYAEGNETFTISLNTPSGATIGAQSTATVTIIDNDSSNGLNPVDNIGFFVRQQYIDFLGREPDPPGFNGWTSTIANCPAGNTSCDRIHVSQLFFQSAEFQERGYFVYRFYPVAFGRKPDYSEFVPDLASVSGFLDAAQLEAAKVSFINAFMARTAFVSTYNSLDNTQYVAALLGTAGVTLSSRQSLIDGLNNSTLTRAQVLRQIVESTEVSTKYNHQAYAVMEYFGYLRRQPDGFYLQWIADLDLNNNPRGMVSGFVTSQEYRNRFGP